MSRTRNSEPIEREIEAEAEMEIERIFQEKKNKLQVEATLELTFLQDFPMIGEYVYGEAFPLEKRITLDIYAPMATRRAITKIICEELMHIKHPELSHGARFWRLVREAVTDKESGEAVGSVKSDPPQCQGLRTKNGNPRKGRQRSDENRYERDE